MAGFNPNMVNVPLKDDFDAMRQHVTQYEAIVRDLTARLRAESGPRVSASHEMAQRYSRLTDQLRDALAQRNLGTGAGPAYNAAKSTPGRIA
jgi:hypothetical protein